MNRGLIREGKFKLVKKEIKGDRLGTKIYVYKTYVSEEYGHMIKEVRDIHDNRLLTLDIIEYNNTNKVVPIRTTVIPKGNKTSTKRFQADRTIMTSISDNPMYSDIINRTNKFLSLIGKYYK